MNKIILHGIPEVHPWNLVFESIDDESEREKVRQLTLDPNLWQYLQSPEHVNKLGYLTAPERNLVSRKLDLARRVVEAEMAIVQDQPTSNIYIEGYEDSFFQDPVVVTARKNNHNVEYLDSLLEMFGLSELVQSGKSFECHLEQMNREDRWVQRILKNLEENKGRKNYLIAGSGHINGDFGLPSKLRKVGIYLQVDNQHNGFDKEYSKLAKEQLKERRK